MASSTANILPVFSRPVLRLCLALSLLLPGTVASAQAPAAAEPSASPQEPRTVLHTTVRRVVLDVVVTDNKGAPVPGLTKEDFRVKEDGTAQTVLSFDANGFTREMDYAPPKLPPQPANTFMNLPSTPEKGPLYVLLYDLVDLDDPTQMNTPEDHHQQMVARQQMLKFIQAKPEGTRFAIFVRSDGLHLVQGFTADKTALYAALDPHSPRPHVPMVFLMGPSFGRGNRLGALDTLHRIAVFLDGLPGRKNLIWFSSMFPLSLFAEQNDGPNFQEETKATLDLMAHNQIAIYPVDARGVTTQDSHTSIGTGVHNDTVTSPLESGGGGSGGSGGGGGGTSGGGPGGGSVQGESAVVGSFNVMDAIARETGGQAFYGSNDVAGELSEATESGGVYYTLSYAPANKDFKGDLRQIQVELLKPGYHIAYRRSYYGTELPEATEDPALTTAKSGRHSPPADPVMDTLSANMQHGAPTAHQLVFVVQTAAIGSPSMGSPEQMAALATEPSYFKVRRRAAAAKPLPPVPLQHDVFDFDIPTRQFKGEPALDLEVAVAAYDNDGLLMNGIVRLTKKDIEAKAGDAEEPRFYRVEQALEVPAGAASLRFAVRDTATDRTGAMEVALPLTQSSASASAGAAH